jgi:flavin reductase (DIM6/NTAB) family NADH-FMN oxidoreductase RutF
MARRSIVQPEPTLEPRALRSALGAFASEVTIVTTRAADGLDVGLTANSFSSVSLIGNVLRLRRIEL